METDKVNDDMVFYFSNPKEWKELNRKLNDLIDRATNFINQNNSTSSSDSSPLNRALPSSNKSLSRVLPPSDKIDEIRQKAICALKAAGDTGMTTIELRKIIGYECAPILKPLIQSGQVQQTGVKRGTRYTYVNTAL